MFGKIILGSLMIVAGVAIVLKTEWIVENFGKSEFFERYLGLEGGSRLGYKLVGIGIIFIGAITATNMIGGFLNWILGPLINAGRPTQQ